MNIGVSAGLLDDDMDKHIIEEDQERLIERNLEKNIYPAISNSNGKK